MEFSFYSDFGNSKKYGAQGKHYSEGQRTSVGSGDPRYRSWYAHSHIKQSRRDDMEAIGFMLMSFLRGDLPWDAVRDYKKPASQSQAIKLKEKPDFNVSIPLPFYVEVLHYFVPY